MLRSGTDSRLRSFSRRLITAWPGLPHSCPEDALRREPLREGDFTIAPHGFFASGGGVTAGDLASCAQGSAPGSFVVEKERAWLFAVPGAEVSFPVKPLPAAIRWEGGDVPFRKNGETISLRLPAGEENYPRLWELELVR